MRVLIIILLAGALTGCAATTRTTRSASDASHALPQMIISQDDIEQSIIIARAMGSSTTVVPAPIGHTVKAGETLWSISKLYGVDVNRLAAANSIGDSKTIEVGQILTIPGSLPITATKKVVNYSPGRVISFTWPVNGLIETPFGSKTDKSVNKGIDIQAAEGANVLASRGGKIVYCDAHLKGFGQTVIIDHMDGFQTVYSYNSDILVKVGDIVQQRDVIARVGSSGRASRPMLHFEIRKNGEPQNPEFYLTRSR